MRCRRKREREKAKTRESEDCSDTKHILGSHMILPNNTISAAVTKHQLYPSPPNTFALQYDPYNPESFPPPIKTLTDMHSKNAPIIIAPHTGYKADILLIVIGVKILKEAEMGISRPQGPRSAPSSPRDGCKNSRRLLSSARIMMDQWARKSVQKLCMLVCQKIIRPRQALRTQRYNTLRLEFVSYNRISKAQKWEWWWLRFLKKEKTWEACFILGTLNLGMWPRGRGSGDPGGGLGFIIPIFLRLAQAPSPSPLPYPFSQMPVWTTMSPPFIDMPKSEHE